MKTSLIAIPLALTVLAVVLFLLLRSADESTPELPLIPDQTETVNPETLDAPPKMQSDSVAAPTQEAESTLVLDEGGAAISGHVVNDAGDPVALADVLLLRARPESESLLVEAPVGRDRQDLRDLETLGRSLRDEWSSGPRLQCDANGTFSFAALAEGAYRIVARSATHVPASSPIVDLVGDASIDGVTVVLKAGASLRGFVINTDREVVEGARLGVRWAPDEEDFLKYQGIDAEGLVGLLFARESAEVMSGADGSFSFAGLVEGGYTLMAESSTYAATRVEDVPTGPEEIQVVLHPELVVRGRVVDRESRPVGGANVELSHLSGDAGSLRSLFRNRRLGRNPSSMPKFKTRSDDEGIFEVPGLPFGTFRATVEHGAYQSTVHPFVAIDEETPEDERDLLFELDAGHRITGIVHDEKGEPVRDVLVEARALEEETTETEATGSGAAERQGTGGRAQGRGRRGGRRGGFGRMYERFSVRQEDFRAKTDQEGRFALSRLPEGFYDLEVRARSFLKRTEKRVETDGDALEIALAAGDVVSGQVLDDETSEPIAGASVRLESRSAEGRRGRGRGRWRGRGRDGNDVRRERTDEAGEFRITGLAGGKYLLRVQAPGSIQETLDLEAESKGETSADSSTTESSSQESSPEVSNENRDILVRLRRAGTILGTVRDRQGRALEKLKVRVARADPEEASGAESPDGSAADDGEWRRRLGRLDYLGPAVLTDEEGNYEISMLRGVEALRVVVQGEPYLAGRTSVIEVEDPTDDIADVDLTLDQSAQISGTVVDASGLVLSGAEVRLRVFVDESQEPEGNNRRRGNRRGRGRWPYISDSTDGLGRFHLSGINTGKFFLEVMATDHLDHKTEPFEISLGDQRSFDFSLKREWTIGGTIYDNSGSPISGALALTEVESRDPRAQFWRGRPTVTGAFGTYRLGKLERKDYDVRASAGGFASRIVRAVSAGSENVDFVLDPLVTLEGFVVGVPSGAPVAEFRARLSPEETHEMSARESREFGRWQNFNDGEFRFEDVPPTSYTLDIEAPSFLPVQGMPIRLTPGEEPALIEVEVQEGGVLTGVVVNLAGQPVAGATVQTLLKAVDPVSGATSYKPSARSGRQGGRRAEGRGRRRGGGGDGDGDGDGGGGNRGRRSTRRQRAAGELSNMQALRNGRAETDEAGLFTVRGLSAGTYKLLVSHDEFVATESRGEYIVVRDGTGYLNSVETSSLTLHPGATIRGRIVVAAGSVTDVSVTTRVSYSRKEAFVESNGRFEMRGLAPGTYEIRARRWPPREGGMVTLEVEVPEGKETVDGVELQVP